MDRIMTEARQSANAETNLLHRSGKQSIRRNVEECPKVGNACGLCKTVQITKDLREFISEAPQDPDEESRMGPEHGEISCNHHHKKRSKTMYVYNCEAHEPTRKRTQETQNKDHEDHIAQKGFHSWVSAR